MEADYLETQPDGVSAVPTSDGEGTSVIVENGVSETIETDSQSPSSIQPEENTGLQVEFMKLDMTSLKSVEEFAEQFKAKGYPLHVLVCNAGVACIPQGRWH